MVDDGTEPQALVGARAYARDERPGYVARDEPLGPGDSGWQVLAGDETPTELDDEAGIVVVPLSALADRWPELGQVLDAGEVGSEWVWDDGVGAYVRLER